MSESPHPRIRVHELADHPTLAERVLFWTLQPTLLGAVLVAWIAAPDSPLLYPLTLLGVHLFLGTLEYVIPARPAWHQPLTEKLGLIVIAAISLTVGGTASKLYNTLLAEPLTSWRTAMNLEVWPHHWPLIVQVFLVFFASEFIWYWMHRAQHRCPPVWRVSGHGAHHSFKKLNAINFGANHPVELFWIVFPAVFVDLVFGVGAAAYGALLLTTTQTAIVHSNLRLNAKGIGWLMTTNAWHIRHHSANLEESNTNYGCAAILWDRVFGTFANTGVIEAGIGPRETTALEKLLIPIREPEGSVIAPSR